MARMRVLGKERGEDRPRDLRRAVVLCLVAGVLSSFSDMAYNGALNGAYASVTDAGRDWSTLVAAIAFVAFAVIGRRFPLAIKVVPLTVASVLCILAGHGVAAFGLARVSPWLIEAGLSLSSVGSVWPMVVSLVALSSLPIRAVCLCLAGAGCVAIPLSLVLGPMMTYGVANVLDVLAQLGSLSLLLPLARPFFGRLAQIDDPSAVAAAHPRAFLPLGSQIFVYIFVFSFCFGYGMRYLGEGDQIAPSLVQLALMLLVLGYGLKGGMRPQADRLFLLAFVLGLGGLLCVLLDDGRATVTASALLLGGYSVFDLLMWFVLAAVSARTTVDAVPAVSWGTAVCYAGILAGAQLCIATGGAQAADPLVGRVVVAALAAGLAVYTVVTRRSFTFDVAIDGIDPVTAAPAAVTYVDPLEEALETVAEEVALTPREREIADLLAHGHNARHIQEALSISGNTVKYHARNVYGKFGVHNQQELIDLLAERKKG